MENTKKLLINDRVIHQIKDFAQVAFKNTRDLSRFDTQEMQIYLILHGLESVLLKNGMQTGFEMAVLPVGDSLPIDEGGLDEMPEELPPLKKR